MKIIDEGHNFTDSRFLTLNNETQNLKTEINRVRAKSNEIFTNLTKQILSCSEELKKIEEFSNEIDSNGGKFDQIDENSKKIENLEILLIIFSSILVIFIIIFVFFVIYVIRKLNLLMIMLSVATNPTYGATTNEFNILSDRNSESVQGNSRNFEESPPGISENSQRNLKISQKNSNSIESSKPFEGNSKNVYEYPKTQNFYGNSEKFSSSNGQSFPSNSQNCPMNLESYWKASENIYEDPQNFQNSTSDNLYDEIVYQQNNRGQEIVRINGKEYLRLNIENKERKEGKKIKKKI